MRNLLKDLLFTKGNVAMDVARTCIFGSVLLYWGAVYYQMVEKNIFDPVQVAIGLASIFSASAAWLHFRQKQEGAAPTVEETP